MKDWRGLFRKMLFPPAWLLFLLVLLCGGLLVWIFYSGMEQHPVAYVVYVLSFYTLAVCSIVAYRVLPRRYRAVRQRLLEGKYTSRYMNDAAFKTHVRICLALAINVLYVALNVLLAVLFHTAWFSVLAGYYAILAVLRFLLARFVQRNPIGTKHVEELRRARLCSVILLLVNLSLSAAVLMIMYQGKGYEYRGILIYAMAAYTFYITTKAIVEMVRYRKYHSPIMSVSKIIALAAALVSMLALETAMLSQFGAEMSRATQKIMVAATGAGISVVIVATAIYMIVRCTEELREAEQSGCA